METVQDNLKTASDKFTTAKYNMKTAQDKLKTAKDIIKIIILESAFLSYNIPLKNSRILQLISAVLKSLRYPFFDISGEI